MAQAKQQVRWTWVGLQGSRKDQWLVENWDGPTSPRIRQLDNRTFCCYRDGVYLGGEKSLEEAKARCAAGIISERNEAIREWEKTNPDEIPPHLQLTAAERAEHWRHHPPRAAARIDVAGAAERRRVAPDALEGGAVRKVPAAPKGGAGAAGKGQKASSGSQGVAPEASAAGAGGKGAPRFRVAGAGTIRAKAGTVPVGKPGTKWQARQRAVLACVGKTVDYCLKHGGDKDAIKHMTLKGVITVED